LKQIHTEIEINAPVSKVWGILTDFDKYPEWNPFVKSFEGEIAEGNRFKVQLHLPEGKPMTFKPKCLAFKENEEFRWLGHLGIKGIFDGEHIFKMKEIEGGKTKFVQCENFGGILLSMMWKSINPKTVKGFEMMNQALKERAEAG
jgi:hypothetical protein